MKLSAEKIQFNWVEFNTNIEQHITGDRKQKLLDFYTKYEDRIILMPAAHKKEYHSAFPGGYVDHVNRVVKAALSMSAVWEGFGCNMTTFTQEELVFSAINHDLGKMGSDTEEAYVPQTDNWRRDKLGED
jgi:23S rRNA maturation-related 3'-5' exoribonuclease YhaM